MVRDEKRKLLLHVCCAPCAAQVVSELHDDFALTGFFYNPNIHPEQEYRLRLSEFRRYALSSGLEIIEGQYDKPEWFRAAAGYEDEPEGGERCRICFSKRIEKTASAAKEMGYCFFATTLTIGPAKSADVINEIGEGAGKKYGLQFLSADFKKRDGFRKSCELSRKYNLYRQNYCGCVFSMKRRGVSQSGV